MKKKISFDIETKEFDRLKAVINKHNIQQGDFLRNAVSKELDNFNSDLISVYVVESNMLNYKTFDKANYIVEMDNSFLTKQLTDDFAFVTSGFLIKNGVKTRFYSKNYLGESS